VDFDGLMDGKREQRTVTFYDNARIFRSPAERFSPQLSKTNPGPDAVKLAANEVTAQEIVEADGRKFRDFVATKNVQLDKGEHHASSREARYSQKRDLVTLSGNAMLQKQEQPGAPARPWEGETIEFNVRTNDVRVRGAGRLQQFDLDRKSMDATKSLGLPQKGPKR
jgi:lipopolysaccharide export system protein LptA